MASTRNRAPIQALSIRLHRALDEVLKNVSLEKTVTENQQTRPDKAASTEIKRPTPGGRCAAVWDQLDHMVEAGQEPTLEAIRKYGRKHRWNENNTRVEFYRWRRAHGLSNVRQ